MASTPKLIIRDKPNAGSFSPQLEKNQLKIGMYRCGAIV